MKSFKEFIEEKKLAEYAKELGRQAARSYYEEEKMEKYKIVIKAKSGSFFSYTDFEDNEDSEESTIELNPSDFQTDIKNINCDADFVEYLDEPYVKKLVSGYMSFEVIDNIIYTKTTYTVKEKLTEEELQKLASYTQGQWSDGIGEGFEQEPCFYDGDNEVYLSPWYSGQKVEITQDLIS